MVSKIRTLVHTASSILGVTPEAIVVGERDGRRAQGPRRRRGREGQGQEESEEDEEGSLVGGSTGGHTQHLRACGLSPYPQQQRKGRLAPTGRLEPTSGPGPKRARHSQYFQPQQPRQSYDEDEGSSGDEGEEMVVMPQQQQPEEAGDESSVAEALSEQDEDGGSSVEGGDERSEGPRDGDDGDGDSESEGEQLGRETGWGRGRGAVVVAARR